MGILNRGIMNHRLTEFLREMRGKRILVQGLGLNGGGLGSAVFFLENGFNIKITDLKNEKILSKSIEQLSPYREKIEYTLGEHRERDFIESDIIVKGPGVPPSNKFIELAIENGAYITSDIEIFFRIAPCLIYGVTGSKGKSTVVSAIYNIFRNKTDNAFLGGNITISPLSFYRRLNEESLVILELSSWQLRDIKGRNIRLKGCAITNLLGDHLNYYDNMTDYLKDKLIITENQTGNDFCIIPHSDRYLNEDSVKTRGRLFFYSMDDERAQFYYRSDTAFFKDRSEEISLFSSTDIMIPGEHVKKNLLLAGGMAYLSGIDPDLIKSGIKSFTGVPYRMELVRMWNGIKFINDTTATMPDASYSAIKSFDADIIWIAGGSDKNLDFSIMEGVYKIPKKIFLLTGNGTDKMKKFLKRDDLVESDSLEFLFGEAVKSAVSGDIVLFSPGCASFGHFQNEFMRGEAFNSLVKKLI